MRILLVSYYFPPYNSVGAVRPAKLAKHLHRNGHQIHVLAARCQPFPLGLPLEIPENAVTYCDWWSINRPVELILGGRSHVSREGYASTSLSSGSIVQRLGYLYKTALHWPDAQMGWVTSAVRAGRTIFTREKFDLIYVSAPPFSGLRVGRALSAWAGVPWVAEFRDLWADNHAYRHPIWRLWIEREWERNILTSASALVTVSKPLGDKLRAKFSLPVWEIYNGFDPDDFQNFDAETAEPPSRDCLKIVFTGNIYADHYDLHAFCVGLGKFRTAGGNARVQVFGRNVFPLLAVAEATGVADLFSVQPTIEHLRALAMQRAADVLLMFLWEKGMTPGIYTTKLFEYAGAKRPVLAIGLPESDVGTLVRDSGLGTACPDAQSVAARLTSWQVEKRTTGKLSITLNTGFDFTRSTQFSRLEHHLSEFFDAMPGNR